MGLAGIVTSVGAEKINKAGLPFASVTADNDAYAACIGAFAGSNGGIVIAGTGSIGLRWWMVSAIWWEAGVFSLAIMVLVPGSATMLCAVPRLAMDGLLQPTALIEEVLNRVGRTRHDAVTLV